MTFPNSSVEIAIVIIFALLVLATAFILALKAKNHQRGAELVDRIRTWWIIFIVLSIGVFLGRTATVVIMAIVSFLALRLPHAGNNSSFNPSWDPDTGISTGTFATTY